MKYANFSKVIVVALLIICMVFASTMALIATINNKDAVCLATSTFENVGKSQYLVDSASGSVIYARNENERLPIASMVKIMTTLLTLESVERGELSLDDDVCISENSASMGGSQVFLDANTKHKVKDLLKSIIVASANDSCVALAEHIAGSVDSFVARMNERAKALEMNNTHFANCTGLPAPESFSCAKDVSIMFRELINHGEYFNYSNVWLEDYKHPDGRVTSITNTNKLIKFYNGCDGGKTGFTSEAKFCLSATAKRADMRVIAVVIGAESAKVRNAAISAMFDYAFANYTNKVLLKAGEPLDELVSVRAGKQDYIRVGVGSDVTQFMKKNDNASYELRYEYVSDIKAPLEKGDEVGRVYLLKDNVVVSKTSIISLDDVEKKNLFDAIKDIGKHWSIRPR